MINTSLEVNLWNQIQCYDIRIQYNNKKATQ